MNGNHVEMVVDGPAPATFPVGGLRSSIGERASGVPLYSVVKGGLGVVRALSTEQPVGPPLLSVGSFRDCFC